MNRNDMDSMKNRKLRLMPAVLWLVMSCVVMAGCSQSNQASTQANIDKFASAPCSDYFDPQKAEGGQDCAPSYDQYCPQPSSSVLNESEPSACDGVTITDKSATANGLTADYVTVQPGIAKAAGGAARVVYLALHWAEANGASMVDSMRLANLAKGRGVTVVAPTAPGTVHTWGSSVVTPTTSLDDRIALIDAILDQVAPVGSGTEVVLAGISGGGVMAFQYLCARSERVSGAILVSSEITPADLASCHPAVPVATVQVNGTDDYIAPYDPVPGIAAGAVNIFTALYGNNGCGSDAVQDVMLPPGKDDTVVTGFDVQWTSGCSSGQGNALVTVQNGGHTWPGFNGPLGLPVNLYGPTTDGFDATMQAFDLLRTLGG